MLDRYSNLRRFLLQIALPEVQELCLNKEENNEVDNLYHILTDLELSQKRCRLMMLAFRTQKFYVAVL